MEAILPKYRIKAKNLTGVIEGGGCHDETIDKGRSFVLGFPDGLKQGKRGNKDVPMGVGNQNIAGFVSFHEGIAGEYCI